MKIFFSYPHDANAPLVERIKADLETRGHEVWFDADQIKSGDDWRNAITRGILESQQVVAFLSSHAVRDPGVCLNEIAIALADKGEAMVTVLVEPETQVNAPVSITHIQWLRMEDWKNQTQDDGWYRSQLDSLIDAIENPSHAGRNAELETLRLALDPMSFYAEIAPHIPGFTGRRWLIERYNTWLCDEPNSRVLRIEGGPGLGKTALASYLAHSTKSSVLAVHLCQYNKGESRNPLRLVRTLAYQLATRLPDYRARLLKSVAIQRPASMQGKDPASLWGEIIASPLAGGGKGNIDRQRLAIIIDGLDEATVEGKNPIVELLAAEINQLPKWIGVVLTGRPDPELTQRLARYQPTVLRDDDPQNIADLKVYVDDWLAQEVKAGKLSTTQASAASKALLDKSQGAFLYLSQARIAVAENILDLSQPDQFPSGLTEIYQNFFERRFTDAWSDESSFKTKVRPLLELVLASPEPLPIVIAKDILKWGPYDGPAVLKSLGSLLKRAKGGLVAEDEETLAPFHNSVREWLQDADAAGDFYVSAESAKYPLTEVVWKRYLDSKEGDSYSQMVLSPMLTSLTNDELESVLGSWSSFRAFLGDLAIQLQDIETSSDWVPLSSAERGVSPWFVRTARRLLRFLSLPTSDDRRVIFRLATSLKAKHKTDHAHQSLVLLIWRLKTIIAEDPRDPRLLNYLYNLAECYFEQANLYKQTGYIELACATMVKAVSITEDLMKRKPRNNWLKFVHSVHTQYLGSYYIELGNLLEGLAWTDRSLKLSENLYGDNSDLDSGLLEDLASSYVIVGGMYIEANSTESSQTLKYFLKAESLYKTLTERDPANSKFLRSLAFTVFTMATLATDTGETDALLQRALALGRKVMSQASTATKVAPENTEFARALQDSHSFVGDVLAAMGDTDTAFSEYHTALTIAEDLVAAIPNTPETVIGLARSLENVGEALVALGRANHALEFFERNLDIRERLAAEDPENVANMRAKYQGCRKLAEIASGDEQATWWHRVLEALTSMQDRGVLAHCDEQYLAEVKANLGLPASGDA
jgi:tetratricopeptide (TPR) repeat protein